MEKNKTTQDKAQLCFERIMALEGIEEMKESLTRLRDFLKNKESGNDAGLALPNYLWVARHGGGITELAHAFAEYLHAAGAMEFRGTKKVFEFKLEDVRPEAHFGELARFENALRERAGYNRYYKGVVCIHIDDWIGRGKEDYFSRFLKYLADNKDKLLVIFSLHEKNPSRINELESVIKARMRLEKIFLRFPRPEELVDWMEKKYLKEEGISLSPDAKELVGEAIGEIMENEMFYGFQSVKRLGEAIIYYCQAKSWCQKEEPLTAQMMSNFMTDTAYFEPFDTAKNTQVTFGFAER